MSLNNYTVTRQSNPYSCTMLPFRWLHNKQLYRQICILLSIIYIPLSRSYKERSYYINEICPFKSVHSDWHGSLKKWVQWGVPVFFMNSSLQKRIFWTALVNFNSCSSENQTIVHASNFNSAVVAGSISVYTEWWSNQIRWCGGVNG